MVDSVAPVVDDTPTQTHLLLTAFNNRSVYWGTILLLVFAVIAIIGPYFTLDPFTLNPTSRLKPPGDLGWFGTDQLGRDVFSRVSFRFTNIFDCWFNCCSISSNSGNGIRISRRLYSHNGCGYNAGHGRINGNSSYFAGNCIDFISRCFNFYGNYRNCHTRNSAGGTSG